MEYLKNHFETNPVLMAPNFPPYLIWKSTMSTCDFVERPERRFCAQKPYRYQDVDPLGAEHFIIFHFLTPVTTFNFKMHPSWEEANVVVRIWGARINCTNGIIFGKWHLLYTTSAHSKEEGDPSKSNYMENYEIINTMRVEFNKNFSIYLRTLYKILSTEIHEKFHLFHPLEKLSFYSEIQTMTHNVPVPERRELKVEKSNVRNFTETMLLPSELLHDIFDRLDLRSLSRCAQVNKRWNLIAKDPYFYRDVDLKMYWNKMNGTSLRQLKEKLHIVRKLDMTSCNEYLLQDIEFNDSVASILDRARDSLTHLCLNHIRLTKHTMRRILECPNLKELRLRNTRFCFFEDGPLSCNRLTGLKTLDVSLSYITEYLFIEILKNSPNLEHLAFDCCRYRMDPELILRTLRNHSRKLKSWSSSVTFHNQDTSLIYEEFGQLIHLEHVNLTFCEPTGPAYGGNCLKTIAKNCYNLKRLELARWDHLTDEQLLPIVTQCKELSNLNLMKTPKITSLTLLRACENLPNLREICIAGCSEISDKMVSSSS
ncbi:hypothetical protein ABEB36_005901 [Hypothenemus hampei]|uniref:F-box domain-containing protein n=1 Tax=Hypothenemus hampei TaxID=57062 RepID=A0ABD1F3M6_HYPHA